MLYGIISFVILLSQAHATGGEVGNGGDSVLCEASSASPYKGYHSLDYLLTLRENNSDLVQVRSWDESERRLLKIFHDKYPDFERLFRDYLSRLPGESVSPVDNIFINERMWLEAPYGLIDIKDERMVRKLPPNCYKLRGGPDEINVIQAVIRQTNQDVVIYNYDPAVLREIKSQAPLQYSFVIVHEWLWDFIHDVEVIRRVNRFLHSDQMERLNADELRLTLQNLGLTLKFSTPLPFCQRSPEVRSQIEFVQHKPCTEIRSYEPVDGVYSFGVKQRGITQFRPGDFSGLGVVRDLDVSGNQLRFMFEDGLFGLSGLKTFIAKQNELKALPERLFYGFPALTTINLSQNQIEAIPDRFFSDFRVSIWADFSGNRIRSVSRELVQSLCDFVRSDRSRTVFLNLLDNPIFADQVPQEAFNCSNQLALKVRPAETRFSCIVKCKQVGTSAVSSVEVGPNGPIPSPFEQSCSAQRGVVKRVKTGNICNRAVCYAPRESTLDLDGNGASREQAEQGARTSCKSDPSYEYPTCDGVVDTRSIREVLSVSCQDNT